MRRLAAIEKRSPIRLKEIVMKPWRYLCQLSLIETTCLHQDFGNHFHCRKRWEPNWNKTSRFTHLDDIDQRRELFRRRRHLQRCVIDSVVSGIATIASLRIEVGDTKLTTGQNVRRTTERNVKSRIGAKLPKPSIKLCGC
ncbi:hypothetical protein Tco_0349460 [Tanacetum coccineum]